MHELSLAQAVVDIIEKAAEDQAFSVVKSVVLEIGTLSHVEPEALRFGFEVVVRGTIAEGAELVMHETPGEGRCSACETTVAIKTYHEPCPKCGQFGLHVLKGTDMHVKELEVEP